MNKGLMTLPNRCKIISCLFEVAKKQDFQREYLNMYADGCPYEKWMSEILDAALEFLDEESQRIIINDFKIKSDHQWWLGYYSHTTYYRLKKKATCEFLSVLIR